MERTRSADTTSVSPFGASHIKRLAATLARDEVLRWLWTSIGLHGAVALQAGYLLAKLAGVGPPLDQKRLVLLLIVLMFTFGLATFAAIRWRLLGIHRRLRWHDMHARWVATVLSDRRSEEVPNTNQTGDGRWPWGAHHTVMLGHLEAAAVKWWRHYDPEAPDTAPTNEMVSDWLIEDRGVSKDKAKAIASILRADNLRTGPR